MCEPEYIDKKLAKLPESIGNFKRRFIGVGDSPNIKTDYPFIIQYTTNGIYTKDSDRTDNEVLFFVGGNSVDDVIERAVTVIDLDKRLSSNDINNENYVYIEQNAFDRGLTNISLVKSFGMVTLKVKYPTQSETLSEVFFYVQSEGYLLSFGRKGNTYFLKKNDSIVSIDTSSSLTCRNQEISFVWDIDFLKIFTKNNVDSTSTPTCYPPNTLYDWARKKLLTEKPSYTRPGKIYNIVKESIEALNEQISTTSDIGLFWDKQFEGKKITKSIPKQEPEITQHIESRLKDVAFVNDLEIMRETQRGNGQIDLTFLGALNDGRIVKVCVEVKRAQAQDLVHGVTVQLPEYMRRLSSNYGIYCILYFGTDYPPKKSQFNISGNTEIDGNNLIQLLLPFLPEPGGIIISPLILDLSKKKSPSKL